MIITKELQIINFNVLHFLIFISSVLVISPIAGNEGVKCIDREREALLKFKAELVDDYGRLSTWGSEGHKKECCKWNGIRCDNVTNHVSSLDLHGYLNAPLKGIISPSLLQLVDISYLDLSNNDFSTITIPKFIGSFKKLMHLKLGYSNFIGLIPPHLGNLSTLRVLDLGGNYAVSAENLDWLSGLYSLQHLDLTNVDLEKVVTWLEPINKLTRLKKLYMPSCFVKETLLNSSISTNESANSLMVLDLSMNHLNVSTFLWFLNFSSNYRYIDFSGNNLEGIVPDGLAMQMSLSELHLSDSNLEGDLPQMTEFLRESTMLQYIDLGGNRLYGSIPSLSRFPLLSTLNLGGNQLNGSFSDLKLRLPYLTTLNVAQNRLTGRLPDLASCSSLAHLRMNENRFNGTLTETIGNLPKLWELDLSSNEFEGVMSETHLFNLSTLRLLDLSFNSNLTIRISSDWSPPFQLSALKLANCTIGPSFPKWIQNQTQMVELDISSSHINDIVPGWFWNNSPSLTDLNMSFNHIYGVIPYVSPNIYSLDLRSNEFSGSLPLKFNASLSRIISEPRFVSFDLSRKKFSSGVNQIFNVSPEFLDLSYNRLSGKLSEEGFMKLKTSWYVNLGNNKLSGEIPNLNMSPCSLSSVHLRNNYFRGNFPVSIRNCDGLDALDLGNNYFTGEIPTWIGASFPKMSILSLRSNDFNGILPSSLCFLVYIKILDISLNDISGTIPKCVTNFSTMSAKPDSTDSEYYRDINTPYRPPVIGLYNDATYISWKGLETEFTNTLRMVKAIDLSSNRLLGKIPNEITSLEGLISLDLSRNQLEGFIPGDIDKLEFLNFLDLSDNNLSGSIPTTLSNLNHLGAMNLSFNNLSGKIPWNTHLETFGSNAFLGNSQLCGPPLLRLCPGDQRPQVLTPVIHNDTEGDLNAYITKGFYVSMAIGFILAFWGTFGTLNFNRTCRIKFSKLLMDLDDWWYVKIQLNKRKLQRYFQNQ